MDNSQWHAPDGTKGIAPYQARELLIDCFADAHRGRLLAAVENLSAEPDELWVRRTVASAIQSKFSEFGLDFEKPTPQSIARVADALAAEAVASGTPQVVIDHHLNEMRKVIERMPH
ncbi:MAG: hypothetical protein OEV43_04040 [Coriobacteriia bacterium]|nr:hypothetical protein [Coriobacteriia bacterium]